MEFDAGDWLRLKENLESQNRQAKITVVLNEQLLKFIDKKLKGLKLKPKEEIKPSGVG